MSRAQVFSHSSLLFTLSSLLGALRRLKAAVPASIHPAFPAPRSSGVHKKLRTDYYKLLFPPAALPCAGGLPPQRPLQNHAPPPHAACINERQCQRMQLTTAPSPDPPPNHQHHKRCSSRPSASSADKKGLRCSPRPSVALSVLRGQKGFKKFSAPLRVLRGQKGVKVLPAPLLGPQCPPWTKRV